MKIILCFSGGLDSTVLLYKLLAEGHSIKCLSVDYGQRHYRELEAAKIICNLVKVEHFIARLQNLQPLFAGSSQTGSMEVPEGHYLDETMKQTVVPNRNMLFISLAGSWAVATKSEAVALATHKGDFGIYPDCRELFMTAMGTTIRHCDWHKLDLLTPFSAKTKTDIVSLGLVYRVPFEQTWTCYKGLQHPCGKCGSCVERQEAFDNAI